jgi:N6-adenosine-specific RNA methylase IME4
MTALARYDAARRALAEACRIDVVIDIHDWAATFMNYARQAKDVELLNQAVEVRLLAERRAGQLLEQMARNGERDQGKGGDRKSRSREMTVKLADLGVTKNQSSHWQKRAALSDEAFALVMASVKQEAIAVVAMSAAERMAVKRERRQERERELAVKIRALPEAKFGVLYADPPWRFEPWSRDTGMDRAADNHYPTMELEEIKALEVPAADDCVLFLWATPAMILQAFEVMATWGFVYKTHSVWIKDKLGTGHWLINQHEDLLIGVKGKVPAPAPGEQWPSVVVEARRQEHSRKPEIFAELIETMFPNVPKLELFARQLRPGWEAWGNEAA